MACLADGGVGGVWLVGGLIELVEGCKDHGEDVCSEAVECDGDAVADRASNANCGSFAEGCGGGGAFACVFSAMCVQRSLVSGRHA